MGYRSALKATGAKVLDFQEFGSYQGEWYAVIEHDDKRELISGSYGSCSGCDSFEAEFGWSWDDKKSEEEKQKALKQFGAAYLDQDLDINEEIEEKSSKDSWYSDSPEIVKVFKEWKEKYSL